MSNESRESTLPIAVEGKVKALEWRYSEHTSNWYADTPFSQYIAWEISRNAYYLPGISKTPVRAGTTIDEAKAAAQNDYQTRILSALISSPGKDGGHEVESDLLSLREAAQYLIDQQKKDPQTVGYRLDLWRVLEAGLEDEPQPASTALVERLTKALEEAEETLRLAEPPAFPDPFYHERVKALGQQIGFGALMSTASAAWREWLAEIGMPTGSEFVAGPCHGTVTATLEIVRSALSASSREGER